MADGGIIDAVVGFIVTVCGWFLKSHNQRLKDMESAQRKTERELSEHQLYTEKVFVKETTLARIHEGIDELREDIKTLIKAVAEK